MRTLHCLLIIGSIMIEANCIFAQEVPGEQAKKNPVTQPLQVSAAKKDSNVTTAKSAQRPLPKFDLPEFIITGTANVDLPKLEKTWIEDTIGVKKDLSKYSEKNGRGRETIELELKNRLEDKQPIVNKYSGILQAGIGTYFTPQLGLWFGQTLADFSYSLNGTYHLTKGYATRTDQSGGSFEIGGKTFITPDISIFQNSAVDGRIGYQSESFYFYGSATPDLERTISDIQIQLGIENQSLEDYPYSARISIGNLNIADSSSSKNETRIDLNAQSLLNINSFPVQVKLHWMSATGGLNFADISGGIQNYQFAGLLLDGSVHLYWAQGMSGQNMIVLRPHLSISCQITGNHRIYASYKPMCLPITLSSNIQENRFLSSMSIIKQTNITDAGEVGLHSDWSKTIQSNISFDVKSYQDFKAFIDSLNQGIWMTAYGGRATIVTLNGEMVAKLEPNDYFASNIIFRYFKNSYWNDVLTYTPTLESNFSANHKFSKKIAGNLKLRYIDKRRVSFTGDETLPAYFIIDVSGEYTPIEFIKLIASINNLTGTRYEIWKGYREFPMTMHIAIQIRW